MNTLLPPSAEGPVFSGDRALPISIGDNVSGLGWRLTLTPPEPLPTEEYRALRFALNVDAGQLADRRRPISVALLPGRTVSLAADGLIDPEARGWQVVEIPLEAFELGEDPIAAVRFLGSAEGVLLIDDLRLVSYFQRPTETAVWEEQDSAPTRFELEQSYPNPFNGEVVISFSLARTGAVELVIYDLLGQQVAILAEGLREAGSHRVRWDGRGDGNHRLASGVYFYRLQTDASAKVGKLVLLQ